MFGVIAHGNSNQQKNYFPESSFFSVSRAFASSLFIPLGGSCCGDSVVHKELNKKQGCASSHPSARRRWDSWNLVFGVLQGQNPVGYTCPLCENMCAISLHPKPSIEAHITNRIRWKTDLQLAKLYCFQKAWWDSGFVDVVSWGGAAAGLGCRSFSAVVLLVWIKLGNTSSRQRYPLGYAKKLLLLVARTLVFCGFLTGVLIRKIVFEYMLTVP